MTVPSMSLKSLNALLEMRTLGGRLTCTAEKATCQKLDFPYAAYKCSFQVEVQ